jgi:hypothetical protein
MPFRVYANDGLEIEQQRATGTPIKRLEKAV